MNKSKEEVFVNGGKMNSLSKTGVSIRRAVFTLMIISSLAFAVAAQRIAPQEQGKMYGDPGFVGEPIGLNVVNTDIREILNYITEQYGINFVIDKSVAAIPVTINVSDVPWNVALDSILQSQELGVQVNGPILRIAQSKSLAAEGEIVQKQKENQLDTSPLYTEFMRLNYARASGTLSGVSGGAGQTTTGVTSASNVGSSGGAGGSDQGILGIVQRRLSRRGSVEVDGRSNTMIITDVRENIDAIRQLVNLLDQPEPQVEIEARIVVATRNFSRDLGVQLSAIVSGQNGRGATFGPAANTDLVAGNPVNTLIGLTTGVFGTAQISALISAGETKGQAKTIATPRVTALNNRPAEIQSGTQIPVTTIQPGGGGGGDGDFAVATTEYVSVPLRLAVTPQITDVGTVILNIVAENSTAQILDSGAPPPISTQSMTTQVMVPDGGTTVIGGVLFDNESETRNSVPGLSKIPILGYLFKQKGVSRTTSELLFFITPRIYRPDYLGNPISGKVSNGTRSTTIIQPVPLGNPPSNSNPVTVVTANPQQQVFVPSGNQLVEPKTGVPVTKP